MSLYSEWQELCDKYRDEGYDLFEASDMVYQHWIKKQQYQKVYESLIEDSTGKYSEEGDKFITILLQKGQTKLYHKYWNFLLNKAIQRFWIYVKHHTQKGREINTQKFLSYDMKTIEENHNKYPRYQDPYLEFIYDWYETMKLIDIYIERMQKINAIEDIEKAKFLKDSIYNLKKPKAKKTTDKRKMSEEVFWELIQESRDKSEFDSDFIEILKEKLEAMSATEIKKFQKLLLEKMNELNHWDIWALAYIVRKGCGDDEFDYFKAWVVSKGKEVFEDLKEMKLEKLKKPFKDSDAQLEEFMYVAQNAYENKQYEEMPMPRVKNTPIQGKEWSEDNICKDYPELCKMFNYS